MLPRIELPEEVMHLYLISAVRTFLSSAVAVFLPLYIYQQTNSVLTALLFTTSSFLLMTVAMTSLILLRRRVSFEWLGVISTAAFVLLFAVVYFAERLDTTVLALAAVLYGISGGIYWLPHHLVYSTYGKERTSSEYGGEAVVNDVVAMLSPIVSGAIAYFLGFHTFFAVASAVSVFSLYLWVRQLHRKTVLNLEPLRKFYKIASPDRALLYFVAGMYTIPFLAYPIYLNFVDANANNVASIGLVIGISFLVDAFISYFLGKYIDRSHDYPIAALGFLSIALIYLHMLHAPALAAFLVILLGFVRRISFLPAMSWVYRLGAKTNGAELYFRELFLMLGRIAYLALLFLASNPLLATMLVGVYGSTIYAWLFYYLSRIRYSEV